MRSAWVVIATVCIMVLKCSAGRKPGGDNCCNGNKILDTIQKVMAYGGHKYQKIHHNRHFTAFTAYLGRGFTPNHTGQRVIFDTVVTNYGNAYNSKDGVFTSPTDGVYTFYSNVLSRHSKQAYTKMALNGKAVSIAAYGYNAAGSYAMATMSAVLELKKGDRVWITTYKGYTIHASYTNFSGWLLHEI